MYLIPNNNIYWNFAWKDRDLYDIVNLEIDVLKIILQSSNKLFVTI